MTRIPYADPGRASGAAQRAIEAVPPLNVFRMLAHAEAAFPAFLRLAASLWNDAELSPRRRELVILRVARLTGAEYEWHQHVLVARMCDVGDDEIAALDRGDIGAIPADDRVVLEMTDVIVRRERASDELLAATRVLLSDRELIELHLVVAVYTGLAAMMTNLDLDLDEQLGAELLDRSSGTPRLGG
jgi:4-carboxymuconolactone decarboxylase